MLRLCLSHILCDLMELGGKKWQESDSTWHGSSQKAGELAMDSNSYMEPEEEDFLPDGDSFVAERVMEIWQMNWYHVCMQFFWNSLENSLFTKLSHFSKWPVFLLPRQLYRSDYRKSLPGEFIRIGMKIEQNCCLFLDIVSSAIMNDLFVTFTSMLKVFISSETGSQWRTILGHPQLIEYLGICILSLAHGSE